MEWLNRMMSALDLMEAKMEEPLDIAELAKTAYSSPYHFQRMFFMLTGMTVAEYVRKRRLTLAAQELALSGPKVIDVAMKYCYDSPESFSKAFRKLHGISPSDARNPGVQLKAFPRISFHLSLKGDKEMDYRIVQKEAFTVIGKSIRTSTIEGENSTEIPKFWRDSHADGTVGRIAALGKTQEMLGLCYDTQQDGEVFKYAIAVETDAAAFETGFELIQIPAATWAVFTSTGPMPGAIQEVWGRIYQEWFPTTGYEQAEGPDFELYPLGNTMSEDYCCEVWIPIVKK
ncbi:effector binding domain-containing protein [Paenibacillus sp. N1-5-1-14]|uniref:AraC family transcriptional regulator n=1 Tax=Paenibacillus radicibacter TaxID=2972488 RepID=UPI0021595B92|nr:effector binding domain-containing protein [Paenibacillus radicibacter]MCR8645924.1 effector binding domain-containing protein [Paenibacillus radicibacter]